MRPSSKDDHDELLAPYPLIRKHLEEREKQGADLWDDIILGVVSINPLSEEGVGLGVG